MSVLGIFLDENGRPISAGLIPSEKGVRICPANGGATNWYSPAYDSVTHLFFFRSFEACATIQSSPKLFEEGTAYYATGLRNADASGKAYINAFNLNTLDFSWREFQIGRNKGGGGLMSTAAELIAYEDDAQNFVVYGRVLCQSSLALPRWPTDPCLSDGLCN